ncbi:MAG: hypothetical protein KF825_12855 [Ferruginibacter sp.]|nr:hypothetical protein [Ferruginibacter sp.]
MSTIFEKIKFRLQNFFAKKEVVPSITEKREVIESYRVLYQSKIFIETGTFLGDTVEYFKNKFHSIISIELSEDLANKAKKRFENDKQVQIIQGDSSKILPTLVNHIKEPILFWLDGHYSSEFFVKDEFIRTAKGDSNTPIVKELEIILAACAFPVILIDDARLFNGTNDYPSINAIKNQVNETGKSFTIQVSNDIIQILPQK